VVPGGIPPPSGGFFFFFCVFFLLSPAYSFLEHQDSREFRFRCRACPRHRFFFLPPPRAGSPCFPLFPSLVRLLSTDANIALNLPPLRFSRARRYRFPSPSLRFFFFERDSYSLLARVGKLEIFTFSRELGYRAQRFANVVHGRCSRTCSLSRSLSHIIVCLTG